MGKGDTRRPSAVPPSEYERRWQQTFGRPPSETEEIEKRFDASTHREQRDV